MAGSPDGAGDMTGIPQPTSTQHKIMRLATELDIDVTVVDGRYVIDCRIESRFTAPEALHLLQRIKAERWARTGRTNA